MGGRVLSWFVGNSFFFRAGEFGVELFRDRAGYFAFDAEDIVQLAIVTFGPNVFVGGGANELYVDVHGIGNFLHASLEHISHTQLPTDFTQIVQQNVFLKPGDTVMVSSAGIIYVSGDVKTPGGYVMNSDENLTVLQALALAQGLNPTASTKNVRIIRRNAGELKQIPVELKQIMAAKAPDIRLESEDVLFVPNSASKSAARRSLESIVQVATGMAIYRR